MAGVTIRGVIALVIGAVGLALGFVLDPARAWLAYLTAFAAVFTVAIGALILQMTGYAANARWMSVVRRPIDTITSVVPLLVVLFVPLLAGMRALYPWVAPEGLSAAEQATYHHRSAYLNVPAFAIRGLIYFVVLLIAAERLRRLSVRRDRAGVEVGDPVVALGRERRFASGMLPPVGLAFTFATIDWLMSLQGTWYSSMFPVAMFATGFLAAIALTTIVVWRTCAVATQHHFHALGRMMFAFVVFWAYTVFFQALLIRIANKPEEISFFLVRSNTTWTIEQWVLIAGYFVIPFAVLMPRSVKFRARAMAVAGAWLVLMHVIYIEWVVAPTHADGVHWVDLAALAAIGGACVAFASWRQRGIAPVAANDPFFADGVRYRSPL